MPFLLSPSVDSTPRSSPTPSLYQGSDSESTVLTWTTTSVDLRCAIATASERQLRTVVEKLIFHPFVRRAIARELGCGETKPRTRKRPRNGQSRLQPRIIEPLFHPGVLETFEFPPNAGINIIKMWTCCDGDQDAVGCTSRKP